MTFFDREQGLIEIEVHEILQILKDSSFLLLKTPFIADLQTGKTATVLKVRNENAESITFITADSEFPVARIEFDSLEKLVQERIKEGLYSLEK